ncbi:MAG TPA: glycoside hydrolase family 66 protein [Gaiellaceae bacterium]|nr:glycoside hydrolase family 66 protein [Gaiellaceae bacterium]
MIELLPTKATFAPGEAIEIELRGGTGPLTVSLWHLDERVAQTEVGPGETTVRFPAQPEGGYGVEAGDARTAVDVLADPLARARYGFVSNYDAGRDVDGVADNVRRLHLNAVQFYDWMYRHADLLPPQDDFCDAIGRMVSLDSVRRLVRAVAGAGSLPLGYAAVYAAGADEWPRWQADGLFRANGEPWTLGDFLWNVDPTSERWLRHFGADLERALHEVGFAGFHLDQYGAPKAAVRADGSRVDLAAAFPALIGRLAHDLPGARLIFNNVNDFPTWSTATADQDAVYIEVWSPHDRLADIAWLIVKARMLAPEQSVILAAYLSVYAQQDEPAARAAQSLLLATAFSHGGTVLLHGETQAALTDPYYVDHKELDDESEAAARRYYDFAVRYGDLLFDRAAVDVTTTHLGGVNEEVKVAAPVPVSVSAEAGSLWARVVRLPGGLLVSLIDLSPQDDDRWDAPKHGARPLAGVRVSLERVGAAGPRFLFAAPEEQPALLEFDSGHDGRHDEVELPAFRTWAIVWIPDGEAT